MFNTPLDILKWVKKKTHKVCEQVQEFWHDLEISTNEKHQELVRVINAHLDRLARDIEDVVSFPPPIWLTRKCVRGLSS